MKVDVVFLFVWLVLFFLNTQKVQKVSFVACLVLRCTATVKLCTQRSSAISLYTSKFKQLYLALIKVLTAKSKERANWGTPLDLLRMVFAFMVTAATRRLKGHFLSGRLFSFTLDAFSSYPKIYCHQSHHLAHSTQSQFLQLLKGDNEWIDVATEKHRLAVTWTALQDHIKKQIIQAKVLSQHKVEQLQWFQYSCISYLS